MTPVRADDLGVSVFVNLYGSLMMFARCQNALEAEDRALTPSPVDVINKCPRATPDYVRTSYLACDYAVPSCRHHAAHRPTSLCRSHAEHDDAKDSQTAALDVVTSHTASSDQNIATDVDDDDSSDDNRRRLSTSRCHCARHGHVTHFGTFGSPQLSVAPPT